MTRPIQTMGLPQPSNITIRGYDLCSELLGHTTFTEMIFLECTGTRPRPEQTAMLDAVLVCLTEHGLTPSALAARLTYLGAPGSIQGSIAAGVLGAGEVFLGALQGCADLLRGLAEEVALGRSATDVATDKVAAMVAARQRIPGLGHPVHKPRDPRTQRLFELAESHGTAGLAQELVIAVQDAAERATGKNLPLNADGACAAILTDLGLSGIVGRGLACVARAGGVLGHIVDEEAYGAAGRLTAEMDELVTYTAPPRDTSPGPVVSGGQVSA